MTGINTWLHSHIYVLPLYRRNGDGIFVNLYHVSAIDYQNSSIFLIGNDSPINLRFDAAFKTFFEEYQRIGRGTDYSDDNSNGDDDSIPF